jgi:hypothetical protein
MSTSTRANLTLEQIMEAQTENFTVTRPFDVADIHLTSVAGAGGQTVTVSRVVGTTVVALSSAMPCIEALGTVERTTLLAVAQDSFAVGDVFRSVGSATATRGRVIASILPDPL